MILCPDQCVECRRKNTFLECLRCAYGYTLVNGECIECPPNCLECFIESIEW